MLRFYSRLPLLSWLLRQRIADVDNRALFRSELGTMTSKILLRNGHATVSYHFATCSRAQSRFYARHLCWPSCLCGCSEDCGVLRRPLPLIMSSRAQKDKGQKQNSNQAILSELLKEEENRYCSDCGAKGNMEFTVFVRLPLQVLLFCLIHRTSWWLIFLASPTTGPRWASWNLGVFLCIRCAGIHRNLGVHISRVKSVNLDSWTPEQMEVSCSVCVFDLSGREFLLTLVLLSLVFRVSSNGEISELRSFGNVIFQVISVALRPTRTIQTCIPVNSNIACSFMFA